MKNYTVTRNEIIIASEIEANSASEAIEIAQDNYCYENYGSGGALTERDVANEEEYLRGTFKAVLA